MDGDQKKFAGVINIEEVKNPILVAKELMTAKDRVLGAEGATAFARSLGISKYNPITEETFGEWKRKSAARSAELPSIYGTVGAVAVDRQGKIAAATSTGGKGMELPGRVSDCGTVAGTFASKKAAVSATGVGEEIVECALAAKIVTRVDDGLSLKKAFEKSFQEAQKHKGRFGAIGIDAKGNVTVQTTTECILYALKTPKKEGGYP
jgi:L-asparaginase